MSEYYLNAKRIVKNGPKAGKSYTGRMISPEGHAFRGEVIRCVRAGHRMPPKLSGPLEIIVLLCKSPTTKTGAKAVVRKGDLDNRWKCLLDALTHAEVIGDDVQFDDQRMIRGAPTPGGRVYISIRRFDPDASMRAARANGLPCKEEGRVPPQDEIPF